jgi:nitrogen regulatory protein PII
MFYPATKLVIVTEHFICEKVCSIIEACGSKGYTLLPAGGKGLHHRHPTINKASVVEGSDNIKIDVITHDAEQAEKIAQRILKECFEDYPGIMYLEEVKICRPDRF